MYYPTFVDGNSGNKPHRVNNGLTYYTKEGTTSAVGTSYERLGNTIGSGTAGNKQGIFQLCGRGAYYHEITGNPTANRGVALPDLAGTFCVRQSGISDSKNSWKVVNFGAFKIYFLYYSAPRTMPATSWNSFDVNLPLTFNKAKMVFTASCGTTDNAMFVSPRVWDGGTVCRVSCMQHYGGSSVTATIDMNLMIIDFS
jgi:hypothetical protein